jgi:hypothetical protein
MVKTEAEKPAGPRHHRRPAFDTLLVKFAALGAS